MTRRLWVNLIALKINYFPEKVKCVIDLICSLGYAAHHTDYIRGFSSMIRVRIFADFQVEWILPHRLLMEGKPK